MGLVEASLREPAQAETAFQSAYTWLSKAFWCLCFIVGVAGISVIHNTWGLRVRTQISRRWGAVQLLVSSLSN